MTVNSIVFLIVLYLLLLPTYRHRIVLCVWHYVLCYATLLNLRNSSRIFLCGRFLGTFHLGQSNHVQFGSFMSSFLILWVLFPFYCLILTRTSSMILNKGDERRYPCLVPSLRGKHIQSFTSKYNIITCRGFVNAFFKLRQFFILGFLGGFLKNYKCVLILSNTYFLHPSI